MPKSSVQDTWENYWIIKTEVWVRKRPHNIHHVVFWVPSARMVRETRMVQWLADSCGQYCGSGMFIQDPNFPSRIQEQKDSGSRRIRIRITEFNYFLPKKLFQSSRFKATILDVYTGARILLFCPSRIQDQGSRKGTGFRIRNTFWGRGSMLDPEIDSK